MPGAYAYTPEIWPPLASAVFLAALSLYSWRRRDVPGALPLTVGSLLGALWLLGMAFEVAAVHLETKLAWHRFQATLQLPAATATTCFALEYTWPGRWLTRRNLTLLALPSLASLLLIIIDDSRFIWRSLALGLDGKIVTQYTAVGAIMLACGLSLVVINAAALLWLFVHSPQHRWPVALMLFGEIAARGLYLLAYVNYLPAPAFDPVIAAILLVWTMYAIALFGFHILDPLPVARQTVIEQMGAGVVVFDADWRVASLNRAAETILGVRSGAARGKTWHQLAFQGEMLPALPDPSRYPADAAIEAPEMTFGSGLSARHYAPALSALRDFRGLLIGHLLLLRDVTEHRQAEEALKESEGKLRLIFENAFDGIAIYEEYPDTGERRILECNERYAQMSGRSRKELLELGDPAVVQKPLAPVAYATPRREIEAAQSEGFFSWVRPDGRENIIEYSAASIRVAGRLLTIGLDRDVTEREQARARILEQQQTLAAVQERERLARELHDGVAQALAAAHLQTSTVRLLLARGRSAEANACLDDLAETTLAAEADVREFLLGAKAAAPGVRPFLPALREYLARFTQHYGLPVQLTIPPELDEHGLPPAVETQLLRIIQEALSNVRKHARASSAQVIFGLAGSHAQIVIIDDGRGFDPSAVAAQSEGYGLRAMRERAESVGGSLSVTSRLGQGTQVTVLVPRRRNDGETR